jgi:hypothetical protein
MDLKRFEYLICRQVHGLGQDHRRHRKALSRRLQAGGPQALHQRQVGRWTAGHGACLVAGHRQDRHRELRLLAGQGLQEGHDLRVFLLA